MALIFVLILFTSDSDRAQAVISSSPDTQNYDYRREGRGGDSRGHLPETQPPSGLSSSVSRLLSSLKLPSGVQEFIAIPRGDFNQCATFLDNNRRFLDSVQTRLFEAAGVTAIKANDLALMHQCVQRLVIIEECLSQKFSRREEQHYLRKLASNDRDATRKFYEAFNEIVESLQREAGPVSSAHPVAPQMALPHTISSSTPGSGSGSFLPSSPDSAMYGGSYPVQTYGGTWPHTHSPFSSSSAAQHGPYSTFSPTTFPPSQTIPGGGSMLPPASGLGPGNNPPPPPTISSTQDSDKNTTRPEDIDIKGSFQIDPEPLDKRYQLQNGREFFQKGRVFSIMFPELKGINPKDKGEKSKDPNVVIGPKGEEIYCHKRRFVVVRQRPGYSACLPINSYQNTSIAKKPEKEAHAIIYSAHRKNGPPAPLPGEEGMKSVAIAVNTATGQDLGDRSRIHCGKPYTIEWNVKVMNVGRVPDNSMAWLRHYWKEEQAKD